MVLGEWEAGTSAGGQRRDGGEPLGAHWRFRGSTPHAKLIHPAFFTPPSSKHSPPLRRKGFFSQEEPGIKNPACFACPFRPPNRWSFFCCARRYAWHSRKKTALTLFATQQFGGQKWAGAKHATPLFLSHATRTLKTSGGVKKAGCNSFCVLLNACFFGTLP